MIKVSQVAATNNLVNTNSKILSLQSNKIKDLIINTERKTMISTFYPPAPLIRV